MAAETPSLESCIDGGGSTKPDCELSGMMGKMNITSVRRINYSATVDGDMVERRHVAIVCDLCSRSVSTELSRVHTGFVCDHCADISSETFSRNYEEMKKCLLKCKLYPISSLADITKTGVCDVQCKAAGHVVTIPLDRERLQNVELAVDRFGLELMCTLCKDDNNGIESNERVHVGANKRVRNDSSGDNVLDTSVDQSTVQEHESRVKRVKNNASSDDQLLQSPPNEVVVHADETVRDTSEDFTANRVHQERDDVQCAVQPHVECPIESAVLGILRKKATPPKSVTFATDNYIEKPDVVTYVPIVSEALTDRFAQIGARCKPLSDRRYTFTEESVLKLDGMQNLAEDTVRALAKYGTFAVDSSRILYRLLCNIRSPIDYNEQDLDRIAQVLTSLRRTSLSCMVGARSMDVIVAQNAVIADIFDLNDHECDDDNALNDDCSIDVTAMLMVMAMGRPTVVDGRPNLDVDETPDTDAEEWCSRYSLKCPTLVAKNLRRYLAADAKYDFMSEYLNVKLRGVATRDDDVNWCKIPISFVHNYIMTRTCFGLVVYDYVLKSCADYKTEPLEFNYNDHMLFVKACSGEVSDYTLSNTTLMSYFDRMLLKYTIPVDVFCSDEMSNYVIHLKKLDASVKVISWSVTSTRIHTERCLMSIHPTLFMIANAVRSADESSPSALLAKFKQLRFNMMMAKCNISSSISDVDKIVENNVQVLRKYCDGDCLPQLIDHVRNKRNSHVTEHRLRKPVQALTNNSTLKRKTIVNDEHSVVLSNKCQLPKKRRLLVL